MSSTSNHQKPPKMCKSPTKPNYQNKQSPKTTKHNDHSNNYEILNTNCTMVGSNNLNLDPKPSGSIINYPNPIKLCTKPLKSPQSNHDASQNLIKKPQSPRAHPLDIHTSLIGKYQNFTQIRGLQPSPTPNLVQTTFSNQTQQFQNHHHARVTKSNFNCVQSLSASSVPPLNNGSANLCSMSPSQYSNPSPSYPNTAVSPYNVQISSPANSVSSITSVGVAGIKSPVASPQNIRPPTPQPILPQAFQQIPVMTSGPNLVQIIHASNSAPTYQNHQVLTRQTIIAPQSQNMQSNSSIIKIKPPLNILPKPPSAAAVPSVAQKQTVNRGAVQSQTQSGQQMHQNPSNPATQIVLPNQTILPAGQQGTLLLNQMPLIVQQNTPQGVQLILRPGTPNSGPQLTTAGGKLGGPQNLILQQGHGGAPGGPQVLIQHGGGQRQTGMQQPQQLVRVLTANGMIQQLAPTYITMNNQQLNIQQLTHHQPQQPSQKPQLANSQVSAPMNIQQNLISACMPGASAPQGVPTTSGAISTIEQLPPPKRKPKKKKKNKEPKLDLANIMKLSGIGDDDDVMFESDASESTDQNHHKLIKNDQQPLMQQQSHDSDLNYPKRIGNIHISAISQDNSISKMSQNTITTSRSDSCVSDKTVTNFGQSQLSVQQSLSDINAINQNLAQIGLINHQNSQNFINANQLLSQIQSQQTLGQTNQNLIQSSGENQSLASFLQALNHNQSFPILNGQGIQNLTSVSQATTIPISSMPSLTNFGQNTTSLQTSNYQKFSTNVLPSTNTSFASNLMSNIATSQNITNVSETVLSSLSKSQPSQTFNHSAPKCSNQTSTIVQNQTISNLTNAHFNLPPNIQVQNFCGANPNLILNQSGNILAPNMPNFSGNITINNSLMPNTNLTLQNNLMPNFLPTNLVQQSADGFGGSGLQRNTGGFKLALSEDGRLILQHDPNLNQDIQSQLMLQSIFGINLQGGNLVLTSVSGPTVPQPPKPITVNEPPKKLELTQTSIVAGTKTTNIIQNVIPSVKIENQSQHIIQSQQQIVQAQQIVQSQQIVQQQHQIQQSIQSQVQQQVQQQIQQHTQQVQQQIQQQTQQVQQQVQQQIQHQTQQIQQQTQQIQQQSQQIQQNQPQIIQQQNQSQIIQQQQQQLQQQAQQQPQPIMPQEPPQQPTTPTNQPNNFSYIVNLTPDQLETLKRNGQLTVNGQTIFMHRPNVQQKIEQPEKIIKASPPNRKTPKKRPQYENKNAKTVLQEHLNIKNQNELSNRLVQPIQSQPNQSIINALQSNPLKQQLIAPQNLSHSTQTNLNSTPATDSKLEPSMPQFNSSMSSGQNLIHIQPQLHQKPQPKPPPSPQLMPQHLIPQKPNLIRQNSNGEQLIIQHQVDNKHKIQVQSDKKLISNHDYTKCNQENHFPSQSAADKHVANGSDSQAINVEQFLSNMNINPANLGQLISQKLSQELPGGGDHKIVNIGHGSAAGQIVAKIDISSENMQQILSANVESSPATAMGSDQGNMVLPPLVSMAKTENEGFSSPIPSNTTTTQNNQQLPPLTISAGAPPAQTEPKSAPTAPLAAESAPNRQTNNNTVYQRIQTIQLTPQKQQLLKSVQLQIQALTARLQQKSNNDSAKSSTSDAKSEQISENDIHAALQHLFLEQQKILATGKVIPTIQQPVTSLNSNLETISTQTVPVTTATKTNNNTFLTSLLQQPVVSHNQKSKVYYHHGNQIIAISPTGWPQNQNILPNPVVSASVQPAAGGVAQQQQIALKLKKMLPAPAPAPFLAPTKTTPTVQVVDRGLQVSPQPLEPLKPISCPASVVQNQPPSTPPQMTAPKRIMKPTYSKAQLIEQQLTTDQNGAMNPDITTPFASKADACKRLVRYHCYNQPVLSSKDLNKADEIFELTARHFIEKFRMMVNKYKYLLFKESMREVQTSELMMIDRMFLAEEQQSFIKLQSDVKLQNELELQENIEASLQDMYKKEPDLEAPVAFEDADVKPATHDFPTDDFSPAFNKSDAEDGEGFTVKTEACDGEKSERYEDRTNTDFNIKCGLNYFSDESCDSSPAGGNFRVYQSPKEFDDLIGKSECYKTSDKSVESTYTHRSKNERYNTTKIIGNFEIEINNKGCNAQESYTKNFRQKIIENKSESRKSSEEFSQKDSDDYDEWLCIQRELGYFPAENKSDSDQKQSDSAGDHSGVGSNASDSKSSKGEPEYGKKSSHKRSSSDSNRLETLKKFRVEKHNSKSKKSGSIIGEVKFEVRIEHKKMFSEQTKSKTDPDHSKSSGTKRGYDYSSKDESVAKRACLAQSYTKNADLAATIKQETNLQEEDQVGDDETFDRSIDEQVQSAIDSILNLQQIASMSMDKPDAAAAAAAAESAARLGKCKDVSDATSTAAVTTKTILNDDFCEPSDTLDEAVKSILS